jgi:uroporphyrinogen decarboxylase
VGDIDFEPMEYLERILPDNMGLFVVLHFFQRVSDLIGFEPMCMMVYEQPELVEAVARKVGDFNVEYTRKLCAYSRFAMVCLGDDMGHRTGTFISPAHIRAVFIPWHQRISDAAHSAGKLCFVHCCGYIDDIMPDLIDTVGCEAHHSTQDVIGTISDFKKRWGSRIAVLGGIDVDFLTRAPVERVQPYVRNILEQCAPGGGFALGVGNWVAASMPVENYLAVLEETRKWQ